MDLRSRLHRAFKEAEGAAEGIDPKDRTESPVPKARLPGREVETPLGRFWLRTLDQPLSNPHGGRRLGELLQVDGGRLAMLTGDSMLEGFTPREAVFIDTETTSLAGGAGVYVFMAGIGFVHQESFRVEQYFMRDFDEEPAMLTAFNERVSGFNAMVSYFGKNFDRYRLEDRMLMLGIESALPVHRHLDLYHVGRRLYRGRFADLRLKTIEESLLDVRREGDIPGAECPEAYFRFLRGKDDGRMADVFYHNLQDILSLAALSAEVDALAADPSSAFDCYALACVRMKGGAMDEAITLLEAACDELPPGPAAVDARLKLIRLLKRMKRRGPLEENLARLLELAPDHPGVLTELAKFHEHILKDYGNALEYAVRARCILEREENGRATHARLIRESERRIDRLREKVKR